MLLLPPCCGWTMAALSSSPSLTSLSIKVDISERSWDDILSSIHVPTLESLSVDIGCSMRAPTFDQFLLRHPLIKTLTLGHDLPSPTEGGVVSKNCLHNLINLSAPLSYIRFLIVDKRAAPTLRNVGLLIKVTEDAIFKAADINQALAPCHARLERVHLTVNITINSSSGWVEFFHHEVSTDHPNKRTPDSLRCVRALDMVSAWPNYTFDHTVLRWLPSLPALEVVSFTRCLSEEDNELSFARRVKQACPNVQSVTLDGTIYNAMSGAMSLLGRDEAQW
ncbi:hypothetical protein B0H13DRAFT_1957223 [Mycena leptocephala]|nr:hypothetical protein B0H13DRAFT_1957223 [Mycena leptocephala]